jgi:hypothetical protein
MNPFGAAADYKVDMQKFYAMVIRNWKDNIRQDPWDTGDEDDWIFMANDRDTDRGRLQ